MKKPFYKQPRIWIVTILICIILISIPLAINYAYIKGLNLKTANTAFSASDWLSLYGTLLGVIATIIALVTTIRFTAHQNLQEQRTQKNTLIAEFNKTELIKNYDEIKQYALKIKNLYLLEVLNDNTTGLARLFEQNKMPLFMDEYSNLSYWINKLNLSENGVEKEFLHLLSDFMSNTKRLFSDASKRLQTIRTYKNEYEEKKQAYEQKKKDFLEKNPNYEIETHLSSIGKKKWKRPVPPYGEFVMDEPQRESIVMGEICSSLIEYRDEHKDRFVLVFDELLKHKQNVLANEISKLFDFTNEE